MKAAGYTLITVGFVVSSLFAATQLEGNWSWFSLSLLVSVIGIFMVRSTENREALHEDTLNANLQTIRDSLREIVTHVEAIRNNIDENNPQAVHLEIDKHLPGHLNAFVEARKSIGHMFGLQVYADVMSFYATGERYLNRVWSASADGYIDEVTDYIARSQHQFEEALAVVEKL